MRSPRKAPRAADCAKYLRRPTQQRRTAGRPRPERAGHGAERRDNWSLSRAASGQNDGCAIECCEAVAGRTRR